MAKTQKKTRYSNVYKQGKWRYYAQKRSKKFPKGKVHVRGTTDRQAGRRLNTICRQYGVKLPNPKLGFEALGKSGRKSEVVVKTEFPSICLGCRAPLHPIYNKKRCGNCPRFITFSLKVEDV